MKVIFIVQGEGRGHLTQAIAMERLLTNNGYHVTEVLVGKSLSKRLPGFFTRSIQAPIKQFSSPNFLPPRANTRANIPYSLIRNLLKLPEYVESMRFIHQRIKKSEADIVINFYELLTGFTYFLYRPAAPLVCIGHQYLFLHKDFHLPTINKTELFFLNLFSRLTSLGASRRLALSFHSMNPDKKQNIYVVPPLLRQDVFYQEVSQHNYIHGYMVNSGFAEDVYQWHKEYPDIPLRFFWDRWEEEPVKRIDDTLSFYQLDDTVFLRQMAGCKAYASTAGFESICEAMYFRKPILMVPAHIEQECNAYDAMQNGAGIVDETFNLKRLLDFSKEYQPNFKFTYWVQSAESIILNELESLAPTHFEEHMYMVEEFV